MPRFRKLTGSFTIRTGEPPDQIVWHFARTPSIERAFTAAQAIDESAARAKVLLTIMAQALQSWEGVDDERGDPLPYSPDAFFQRIPARLRAEILRRWIAAVLGAPVDDGTDQATPPQEGRGAAVVDNQPSPTEEQPPASTPSSSGDGLRSDSVPDHVTRQLPFRMETNDRPADEGTFDIPPGAASHRPLAQSSLPFTDPAAHRAPDRSSEAPDASRQAPRSAELPSVSGPDPRVAQASSRRPLPPGPAQQSSPTARATPSAPAAAPAARSTQSRLPEAQPAREPLPDLPPASPPCTDQVCPLLDPDFDWQPVIRPAWETLHKQTRREETAEAAF